MKKIFITACMAAIALAAGAQRPLSFHAKVGIGTSSFWGEHSSSDTRIAYKAEIGAQYALNRTFALQSALEFVSIGGEDEIPYIAKAKMEELYLQIPVLMSFRLPLGKHYQASLSVGPYVAVGIGGKTEGEMYNFIDMSSQPEGTYFKVNTFGSMMEGNMGNQRFDMGATLRLAFEYRHLILGAEAQAGFMTVNKQLNQLIQSSGNGAYLPKNLATYFTLGYRF